MKNLILYSIAIFLPLFLSAQSNNDTVVVNLAHSSKMMLIVHDRIYLELFRQYDYQALFDDMLDDLEDTTEAMKEETTPERVVSTLDTLRSDDYHNPCGYSRKGIFMHSNESINFDFGMNNYLSGGKFPDQDELYTVRPWGSWYIAVNAVKDLHVSGPFYVDLGLGISAYNFKFQKDNILVRKDDNGVVFSEDARDVNFIKSKLTVSYLNASVTPLFKFGRNESSGHFWNSHGSNFRIGAGAYVGYRTGSRSKIVFDDGDKTKERERDNFDLNNFRYGARLQLGIHQMDFFFNYDLNKLFDTDEPANPDLNAFSFGVTF